MKKILGLQLLSTNSTPTAAESVFSIVCPSVGSDAGPVLLHVLVRVIGRAHQRTGGDVLEAEVMSGRLQRRELLRLPVAHDRQMALGGPQVLADGEDGHAGRAQV